MVELIIPIEIPTKEAKAEMETHPVIHFGLFLQLNNFLFHLFFSI